MKKKLIILLFVLILCAILVFAIRDLTREQRNYYNACKKNCSTNKMLEKRACNIESYQCRQECRQTKVNCSTNLTAEYKNCKIDCNNLSNTKNLTRREMNKLKRDCRKNCSNNLRAERRVCYIDYRNCSKTCSQHKWQCKKDANGQFTQCRAYCIESAPMIYNVAVNQTENNTNQSDNETNGNNETENNRKNKISCPKYRPTDCTEEYEPVCSQRNETYSNKCFACQDNTVSWYTVGAC